MRARYLVVAALAAVAAAALFLPRPARVVVAPGTSLQAVLDGAAAETVVVLEPGVHRGPVTVSTPVDLHGEPGAIVEAPRAAAVALTVAAGGTRVSGVRVEGAETGILVRAVNGVAIEGVQVSGAQLHGIEVVDASARIASSTVEGLLHPMAQGIEIRNSDGRPDTVIEGVRVTGGQEGIVSHVSEVEVRNSEVAETTMRGIAITEMSDGVVTGNRVTAATGTGLFCGDMSRCAFESNSALGVAAAPGGRSSAGWGLVVTYHSAAWSHDNQLGGDAGPLMTSIASHMRERSPLDPGSPADLVIPMAAAMLVALGAGAAGYFGGRAFRRRGAMAGSTVGRTGVLIAFLLALGVQTFHMVEHWLQVYRIHVDHIPSRGGLLGPTVESEWVHLTYNTALVVLLVLVLIDLRRVAVDGRIGLIGGAVLIQGWHSIEHFAKITQHIVTGAKVNPGLIGSYFDLVWFHFTINLTVYGLCVAAALLWLRAVQRPAVGLTARPVAA